MLGMRNLVLLFAAALFVELAVPPAVEPSVHGQQVPAATITLPPPAETTLLYAGWNNVSLTFEDGTAIGDVADAVEPEDALDSIWRFEAGEQVWQGYDPDAPPGLNTLALVVLGDIVLIH